MRDLDLGTVTDDDFRLPPREVRVARTFPHPEFRSSRGRNDAGLFSDIALLKLEQDLGFSGELMSAVFVLSEPRWTEGRDVPTYIQSLLNVAIHSAMLPSSPTGCCGCSILESRNHMTWGKDGDVGEEVEENLTP